MHVESITLSAGDHTGTVGRSGMKGKKKGVVSTDPLFAELLNLTVLPEFLRQACKETSQGGSDLKKDSRQSKTADLKKITDNHKKLAASGQTGSVPKSDSNAKVSALQEALKGPFTTGTRLQRNGEEAGSNVIMTLTDKNQKWVHSDQKGQSEPVGTPENSQPVLKTKSVDSFTDSILTGEQTDSQGLVNNREKSSGTPTTPTGTIIPADRTASVQKEKRLVADPGLTADQVRSGLAKLMMTHSGKRTSTPEELMSPANNPLRAGSAGSKDVKPFSVAATLKSNPAGQMDRSGSVTDSETTVRHPSPLPGAKDLKNTVAGSQPPAPASRTANAVYPNKIMFSLKKDVSENAYASGHVVQNDLSLNKEETRSYPVALKQMSHAELLVSFSNHQTGPTAQPVNSQIAQQFVNWMGRTSFHLETGDTKSLTVTLSPQSLGPVTVTVTQTASGLVAHLIASTKAARDLIQSGLGQLRNDFSSQGIVLNQLDVSRQWQNTAAGEVHQTHQERSNQNQQGQSDEKDDNQKKKRIYSINSDADAISFLDLMKGGVPIV
jgi:Flagellar hook-length control protein